MFILALQLNVFAVPVKLKLPGLMSQALVIMQLSLVATTQLLPFAGQVQVVALETLKLCTVIVLFMFPPNHTAPSVNKSEKETFVEKVQEVSQLSERHISHRQTRH